MKLLTQIKKMDKKVIAAIVVVIIIIAMYVYPVKSQGTYGDGDYTIYGSESCPWTVKALEHGKKMGHAFNFTDCKSEKCPSFVNGFPTYKNHKSGNIKSGFTETPHDI